MTQTTKVQTHLGGTIIHSATRETVARIQSQLQAQGRPTSFEFNNGHDNKAGEPFYPWTESCWRLFEKIPVKILGFIPSFRKRFLFALADGLNGQAYRKNDAWCMLMDRTIEQIVREKLEKFADEVHATKVELTLNY